jgi:hypothetical protein
LLLKKVEHPISISIHPNFIIMTSDLQKSTLLFPLSSDSLIPFFCFSSSSPTLIIFSQKIDFLTVSHMLSLISCSTISGCYNTFLLLLFLTPLPSQPLKHFFMILLLPSLPPYSTFSPFHLFPIDSLPLLPLPISCIICVYLSYFYLNNG